MSSPITKERSDLPDLPSPKRQKVEETTYFEHDGYSDYDGCDSDVYDEAVDRFREEYDKSEGYEMDFSKLRFRFGHRDVKLDNSTLIDDSTLIDEPQTNRDLMIKFANEALSKYNADQEKCLELGEILRAHWHPSCGLTYYISFLVNDLSDPNRPKSLPYRAMVQHRVTGDIIVHSCYPKPLSSS